MTGATSWATATSVSYLIAKQREGLQCEKSMRARASSGETQGAISVLCTSSSAPVSVAVPFSGTGSTLAFRDRL
jgi:hypothetical protein